MPNVGDTTIFLEHLVIVKDIDSSDEEPVRVMVKKDEINYSEVAERYAKNKAVLAMNGNTLEAEYHSETGKSVEAEWRPTRYGWVPGKELTAAASDDDSEHFKHG